MKRSLTRRTALRSLLGVGGVGLAALATGIPRSVLLDPLGHAHAQDADRPRMLILTTSERGDPINTNAPGTYENASIIHPADASMAPVDFQLGEQSVRAARPWSELPESIRNRMTFIHHATYANTHPSQPKVMRLTGNLRNGEMLVSMFSKALAPALETTQVEPISLGAAGGTELLSFEGRILSAVQPVALKQILGDPEGPLGQLQEIRDQRIDELHALFREHGTENHRRMLDRFAQSRMEARTISLDLLDRLDSVRRNDAASQIIAAPVVAAMNVSPVLTIRIPFGGDNHNDQGLARETRETISGLGLLTDLMANIETMKNEGALRNEVVVANLSVFGRTLVNGGQSGRDHNGNHHTAFIIGDTVRPSVIGGVVPEGDDFGAAAFDSTTGAMDEDGDVSFETGFGSMAKTMGRALGIGQDVLDEEIVSGKTISAALLEE